MKQCMEDVKEVLQFKAFWKKNGETPWNKADNTMN